MDSTAITVTVLSSIFLGIIAVIGSSIYHRKYESRKVKRDVFRRFAGNRHLLTFSNQNKECGEPYISLNEAFIVFSDCPNVIKALKKLHEELGQQGKLVNNLVTLTKEMAKATKVKINENELNDNFIESPFAPSKK